MRWLTADKDGPVPLWHYAEINPITPEFRALENTETISFMPLETVWPGDRADISRTVVWGDVKDASYTQFRRGDVLVPKISPTFEAGRSTVANIPNSLGLATTEVHVIRPIFGTDARWLCYNLLTDRFLGEGGASLVGVGNLRRISSQQVGEFGMPECSPDEQRRIADYLDAETAQIDTMLAQLDRLEAELGERRTALQSDVLPAPPLPFRRFASDGIPAGWSSVPLWKLFTQMKVLGHTELPMVSVFRELGVVYKDAQANLNRTAEDRSIYQLLDEGWLVVNRMKAWQGSLGVSTIRGITSGHYLCFEPNHEEDDRFLNALFRSRGYRDWLAAHSRGVRPGQAEIDNDYLRRMPVLVPPLAEQRRIVAELDEQTARIDGMLANAARLKSLLTERRSALITAVVTGQKEVP